MARPRAQLGEGEATRPPDESIEPQVPILLGKRGPTVMGDREELVHRRDPA
jgi:hypothetical protein